MSSAASDLFRELQRENPGLFPQSPAKPAGGICAERVAIAGGQLGTLLLHPTFVPFQTIFRRLPDAGIFTASATNQYFCELGAVSVPRNMALAVAEVRFQPFRFSGAAAGDAIPLEEGRLPLSLAYDLNIDQTRKGQIKSELFPQAPTAAQAAFAGVPTGGTITETPVVRDSEGRVLTVYSNPQRTPPLGIPGAGMASDPRAGLPNLGDGLLVQSQRAGQGPSRFPFTFYAEENQAVQLRVIAFGRVVIPIAFFQATLAGYLMPQNTLREMLRGVAPCP